MKILVLSVALSFACAAAGSELTLESHPSGIWAIAPTAQANRWLIIHNLSEAKNTGVYHIEVIARTKKSSAWQTEHLVNHMAISKAALLSSIIKPLKSGGVYPETFDYALTKWRMENAGEGGAICTTTVIECMK